MVLLWQEWTDKKVWILAICKKQEAVIKIDPTSLSRLLELTIVLWIFFLGGVG